MYLMDLSKVSEQKIALDARLLSYQQVVKYVRNHLYAGDNCTNALANIELVGIPDDPTGPFDAEGMSISLNLNAPKPYNKVMKAPVGKDVWFINGGTSVKDVLLYVTERVRTPVRLATLGSEEWTAAKGYILIIPGHSGVGAKLARGRQYRIPIFIYYHKYDKSLKACFDPGGDAYFCTVMGGAYDATATNPDMRCQPDRTCFPYKSGIVNSPGSCPTTPPYTASMIGFMGSDLYLCDWCNPNGIAPEQTGGYYYEPYPPNQLELDKGYVRDPYTPPSISP